jgi:hypothetical protein
MLEKCRHVLKMSPRRHSTCRLTTLEHQMSATCHADIIDILTTCRQRQDMSSNFSLRGHDTTPTFPTKVSMFVVIMIIQMLSECRFVLWWRRPKNRNCDCQWWGIGCLKLWQFTDTLHHWHFPAMFHDAWRRIYHRHCFLYYRTFQSVVSVHRRRCHRTITKRGGTYTTTLMLFSCFSYFNCQMPKWKKCVKTNVNTVFCALEWNRIG